MTAQVTTPRGSAMLTVGGALSGVAFVALVLLAPEPASPGERAAAESISRFYAANAQAFITTLLVSGLAYLLFVVFQASLAVHLRRSDGAGRQAAAVAMAAALLIATFQGIGTALWAAPALVATPGRDPGQVADLALLGSASQEVLVVTATFWRVLLLAAVAFAVLRHGALYQWFGWLTALLAVVSLVAPLAWAVMGKSELISVLGFASHIAFYPWVLVASAALAVRLRPTTARTEQVPLPQPR